MPLFKRGVNGGSPGGKKVAPPVIEPPPAMETAKQRLVFHCQQAQGSPTGLISGFSNVKELYAKVAEVYEFPASEVTFFQLFKISNFNNDSALIVYALSPNYFGFNYGFVSGVAYLSMSLMERVEFALKKIGTEWVFYFYCLLKIFSCLTMLLSGGCHPRDFDSFGTVEWKDESFVSFP